MGGEIPPIHKGVQMDLFQDLNKFGVFLFGFCMGIECRILWVKLNEKLYKWYIRRKNEKSQIKSN